MRRIALIGFMGCGKTTVGQLISEEQQIALLDTDALVAEKTGMNIAELFGKYGEAYFRQTEHEVLEEISKMQDVVVSTGGGIVLNSENRELLKAQFTVFFLHLPIEVMIDRIQGDTSRPVAAGKSTQELKAVYYSRLPLYIETADYIVSPKDNTSEEACKIMKELLVCEFSFLENNFIGGEKS